MPLDKVRIYTFYTCAAVRICVEPTLLSRSLLSLLLDEPFAAEIINAAAKHDQLG